MANNTNYLFAGYHRDVYRVLDEIGQLPTSVTIVTEETNDDVALPQGCVVVYVLSRATRSSSCLLSWFAYVYDHLEPCKGYLLGLDGLDVKQEAFENIKHLPTLTLEQLRGEWMSSD